MNLDYQEIMALPEPENGADVGTLDSMQDVYHQVVGKFTRLVDEAKRMKMCFLQEKRVAKLTKNLTYFKRVHRYLHNQYLKGQRVNFCLRVRTWVLSSSARRAKVRALIGDKRIEKWQEKKLILAARKDMLSGAWRRSSLWHDLLLTEARNGGQTPLPTTNDSLVNEGLCPKEHEKTGRENRTSRRGSVGNWYRLPSLPRQINPRRGQNGDGRVMASVGGMRRAVPSVVFWPDELGVDDLQAQDPSVKSQDQKRPCPPMLSVIRQGDTRFTQKADVGDGMVATAREGPD